MCICCVYRPLFTVQSLNMKSNNTLFIDQSHSSPISGGHVEPFLIVSSIQGWGPQYLYQLVCNTTKLIGRFEFVLDAGGVKYTKNVFVQHWNVFLRTVYALLRTVTHCFYAQFIVRRINRIRTIGSNLNSIWALCQFELKKCSVSFVICRTHYDLMRFVYERYTM